MPYYITDQADSCPAWALVKQDGEVVACHETESDAIDQMIAISLAEGIEPGGTYTEQERDSSIESETRAAVGTIKVGDYVTFKDRNQDKYGEVQDIVENGTIAVPGSAIQLQGSVLDPALLIQIYEETLGGWQETGQFIAKHTSAVQWSAPMSEPMDEPEEDLDDSEESRDICEDCDGDCEVCKEVRQVNLTPPAYMRAAARQGLRYYEEGKGGDGLVERTIREARAMAAGNVTADKWVRIRAWIARHLVDLDSPAARPDSPDYPSAGVVAHLLWGSGPSKRSAQRALTYAEGVVSRIEAENEGRAKGEALSKIETRTNQTKFEVREESEGMRFTGYAAVWNSPSEPLPFTERIAPGAFRKSLRARNDIKFLWNHDAGEILGSTRAGTMTLREDANGLRVDGILPNTSRGRDVAELLRRGDVDSMSFGFSVPSGGDEWTADGSQRTLKSVRLHEVSLVAWPAYTATTGSTQVRTFEHAAERSGVDADALADAIIKLEIGSDLSETESSLLNSVIDALSPKSEQVAEPAVEAEQEPTNDTSEAMLELKKMKLKLLMDRI
jgi:HK97 family phage prohead protease